MKESITKFDLEAAFKALDEIDIPVAEKVKANRPALTEIFSRKSKFDALMEEYYDISSTAELDDAKEAREAEVAKAKLARIEKIVDLEADSPEDLLTSYVGKYIMQCPQCMTLFYKNPEDVVEAEDDPDTVNVNEVCQHCGNESGYTLIGKVGEAAPDEFAEEPSELEAEEIPELTTEEGTTEDDTSDEATDEANELGDLEALDLDLDLEPEEDEEKKEESFTSHIGETLVEELSEEADLDAKLEAHNEYIEYLRVAIAQEEKSLEKATNEQVKAAIQRNIDTFKADLEAALPDAVKDGGALPEEPVEETAEVPADMTAAEEVSAEESVQEESFAHTTENMTLTESIQEDTDLDISADEFEDLINSPEFNKPISDTAVRAMLNTEKETEEEPVKESISVYHCDDCGCDIEISDKDYTGKCPQCNEHHGFYKLEETLTEGGLLTLGKALGKKVKQAGKNLKDKVATAIDNIADNAKTHEEKADWLLANALEDYDKAKVNNKNELVPDESNQRFKAFVVIGYKNKYSNGKTITIAPSFNNKDLVIGKNGVQAKKKYKDAESIAKGWSMTQGNGPAFIYLAKSKDDNDAVFLCEYFKGELENDQLEKYFNVVKNHLKGAKLMAQGNMEEEEATEEEVTESIDTIMTDLDELKESTLETLISDSLIEAYGNVAGFRLIECAYADNKFTVDGTIYFTSGKTRKTAYIFNESYKTNDKISLCGLNEKLGLDKQFTLTGYANNRTFIAESFTFKKK